MAPRIFVTGGRGMVGRNICEHTKAADYEIIAPNRDELDLMDSDKVRDFVAKTQPEFIIHSAGTVGGIQANIRRPVDFLVDNLKIGMNVILAARASGIAKVMNIGSSCMYPRDAPNPLREELILRGELEPTNEGYAIAKVTCARLCDYIQREQPELHYKTLIPSNLYGRYDKFDPENSHMMPAIIRKIDQAVSKGIDMIDVWGDGQARREFMYAGELADFIFYALDRFDQLPQYLNVGLGYDYTVNEYYKAVANVLGYKGNFAHDLSKPAGMAQKLVDVSNLHKFGWKSKLSLEEGIAKTYEYYLKEAVK